MRCFACDCEAGTFDGPTGRFYCTECMHVIRMTANASEDQYDYSPAEDDEEETLEGDLTIVSVSGKLDIDQLKRETGIDVSQDASDMSALWS